MTAVLELQTRSSGPEVYWTTEFRRMIEDHLDYLLNDTNTVTRTVEPHESQLYENDFYGLMDSYVIPYYMHWVCLRVNGFTDPSEFDDSKTIVYIPDENTVSVLARKHNTNR